MLERNPVLDCAHDPRPSLKNSPPDAWVPSESEAMLNSPTSSEIYPQERAFLKRSSQADFQKERWQSWFAHPNILSYCSFVNAHQSLAYATEKVMKASGVLGTLSTQTSPVDKQHIANSCMLSSTT